MQGYATARRIIGLSTTHTFESLTQKKMGCLPPCSLRLKFWLLTTQRRVGIVLVVDVLGTVVPIAIDADLVELSLHKTRIQDVIVLA